MNEAVYSWIDYAMLWISAAQFIVSLIGIIGIVYTIKQYKQALRSQTESQAVTHDTLKALSDLINSHEDLRLFEKNRHKRMLRPEFSIEKVNDGRALVIGVVRFKAKLERETARLIRIKLLDSPNWNFVDLKGNVIKNPMKNILPEGDIIEFNLRNSVINNPRLIEDIGFATLIIKIEFHDVEYIKYSQTFFGDINNMNSIGVDEDQN